eukprot:SAG31_NODE_773_length_12173_cov_15.778173_14_plen_486_part_00
MAGASNEDPNLQKDWGSGWYPLKNKKVGTAEERRCFYIMPEGAPKGLRCSSGKLHKQGWGLKEKGAAVRCRRRCEAALKNVTWTEDHERNMELMYTACNEALGHPLTAVEQELQELHAEVDRLKKMYRQLRIFAKEEVKHLQAENKELAAKVQKSFLKIHKLKEKYEHSTDEDEDDNDDDDENDDADEDQADQQPPAEQPPAEDQQPPAEQPPAEDEQSAGGELERTNTPEFQAARRDLAVTLKRKSGEDMPVVVAKRITRSKSAEAPAAAAASSTVALQQQLYKSAPKGKAAAQKFFQDNNISYRIENDHFVVNGQWRKVSYTNWSNEPPQQDDILMSVLGRLKSCGVTERAIASKLKISPAVVSSWKRGRAKPVKRAYGATMKALYEMLPAAEKEAEKANIAKAIASKSAKNDEARCRMLQNTVVEFLSLPGVVHTWEGDYNIKGKFAKYFCVEYDDGAIYRRKGIRGKVFKPGKPRGQRRAQ